MRTNRFALILLLSSIVFPTLAQTQQGYVKTLGRPEKKGVALSGVSVRLKGGHNAVLSKDDGTFSMLMTGMKVGDAYSLQQVQKAGYELNEIGVIGRQYAFSDKVPLNIVMVSTSQLQAEKQRIENNAYKVAEKNYHAKLTQLEKDKESGTITIEQYRTQIQDLQDKFEKYQSLIDGLAEHYAHTDYDALDENEREINICIENGDLERADSLIHTIFDPIDVLKRNKEALSRIDQNIQEANDLIAQANADMAAVLKHQEKDAEHLYQLYSIALSRFDNEKALSYIESRAELDTTNVKWQNEAGRFFLKYIADYKRSQFYFQRMLRLSSNTNLQDYLWSAIASFYLARIEAQLGNFSEAQGLLQKSVDTFEEVEYEAKETSHYYSLNSYIEISSIWGLLGHYDKALEVLLKIASLKERSLEKDEIEIANIYNEIGVVYAHKQNATSAIFYFQKALNILEAPNNQNNNELFRAAIYVNLGYSYNELRNYNKALVFFFNGLNVFQKILYKYHPDIASCYNNIGFTYKSMGNYNKSLEYYKDALIIWEYLYGDNHHKISEMQNNIGVVCFMQGKYKEALDLYLKSLPALKSTYGERHTQIGDSYNNIGTALFHLQDYQNAAIFLKEAIAIKEDKLGTDHPSTKMSQQSYAVTLFACLKYGIMSDFTSECVYTAIIENGDNEAHKHGLSGEYIVLEYGEWSQESTKTLFDVQAEMEGKSKDVVVMKNDVITQHHFENVLGISLDVKYVGKEEVLHIKNIYDRWKERNRK